jgi:hypothetical protein
LGRRGSEPARIVLHDAPVCAPAVQGEAMLGDALAGQRFVTGPVTDEVERAVSGPQSFPDDWFPSQ